MKYFRKPNIFISLILILCISGLCVLFSTHCRAEELDSGPYQVIVFVSKNIRPYLEALDGLRANLADSIDADVEVILLDRYDEKTRNDLVDRLSREITRDIIVAIGPEAASFVWKAFPDNIFSKIYSIILNPEKVIGTKVRNIGIPLNIPPENQLSMIAQGFPAVRRLGVFFDPKYNDNFYAGAAVAAFDLGIDLIPLSVDSKKDIPFLLQECWDSLDCIWLIPDRTVISESIAQYIIKQAVLKKVPVVGYNQFFYNSGAAMAFVFDYADIGRQTAGLITNVLQQKAPGRLVPVFKVWLNETVLEKMEIEIPKPIELPMVAGP